MKKCLVFIFVLLRSINMFSQSETESSLVRILERTPAAPNTASLGKYFDVPVNMATGIPDIKVPIYTIKSGNIELPIYLSYHGRGIMVNDPASWVGLGWDLICGGVVTKQVNGLDDFYSTTQISAQATHGAYSDYLHPDYTIDDDLGFTNMSDLIDSMQGSYALTHANELNKLLGRIVLNYYDGESDLYHYSTPDGSGSIFWNQKTAKFQLNKIDGWAVYMDPETKANWSLSNKLGITYSFGDQEKTLSSVYPTPLYWNALPPTYYYTSAWYLSNIVDWANNKTVTITYEALPYKEYDNGVSENRDYNMSGTPSLAAYLPVEHKRYGNELLPEEINFSEGRIVFVKNSTPRLDNGPKALDQILIYDKNNDLKKKFVFNYQYVWGAQSSTTRLFLASIQEVNYLTDNLVDTKPYLFTYDTTNVLPPRFSFAQDIYGYNNGKTQNTTIIPTETITQLYGLPSFADRSIDTNYTRTGILKAIQYPTGGTLNFEFESNRDDNNALIGGLRVRRIINYDSVALSKIQTEYYYTKVNGNSTAQVQYRPQFHYFYYYGSQSNLYCRVSGEPFYPLYSNQGSPVLYSEVEERQVGEGINIKSRHYYSNYLENPGTTEVPSSPLIFRSFSIGVPFNKYPDLKSFSSIEYKSEQFKFENNQYSRVRVDSLEFGTLNSFNEHIWNVQASWAMEPVSGWVVWPGNDPYAYNPMNTVVSVNAYKLFRESLVNTEKYTKVSTNNGELVQKVIREFDQNNGNVKKVTSIASNGDTLRTYYKYACDFNYTNSADPNNWEINAMLDANANGLPIEVVSTVKSPGAASERLRTATLYLYSQGKVRKHFVISGTSATTSITASYNNNMGFYMDSHYELESEIISFDSEDNPTEIKLKDKTQCLIWDGENIMASVINSGISDIAATSFETNEKGSWVYTGNNVTESALPTGSKAYSLSSGSILRSSLNASKTYIVSFWQKTGASVAVSGGSILSNISGRVYGDWTLKEYKVSGAMTITISGAGVIDELRLYPDGALMVTYTYEPLAGITSQCDAVNGITYYEYDGLNRLKLIRDQNGNVIKKMDYKYFHPYNGL